MVNLINLSIEKWFIRYVEYNTTNKNKEIRRISKWLSLQLKVKNLNIVYFGVIVLNIYSGHVANREMLLFVIIHRNRRISGFNKILF